VALLIVSKETCQRESRLTTISTRRQEQGFVSLGALRGVFGFGSLARSALVKWNVRLLLIIEYIFILKKID